MTLGVICLVYLMKNFYSTCFKHQILTIIPQYAILALISYQFCKHLYRVFEYELYINKTGSSESDMNTTKIAQSYFDSLLWLVCLSFLLGRKCFNLMVYICFLSIFLWFSNAFDHQHFPDLEFLLHHFAWHLAYLPFKQFLPYHLEFQVCLLAFETYRLVLLSHRLELGH